MMAVEPSTDKMQLVDNENKLLQQQQQNYRELCKILALRHLEILKYLNQCKDLLDKIMKFSKDNVLHTNYLQEKSTCEAIIAKYDKQIQSLTDNIQTSQALISDNEENLFKEHLKLLSNSLVNVSNKSPKTSTTAMTVNSLESHVQNNHNHLQQNHPIVAYHAESTGIDQLDISDIKVNEVFFLPQLELEVLDFNHHQQQQPMAGTALIYSNPTNNGNVVSINNNKTQKQSTKTRINKNNNNNNKLVACEQCGKLFNRHYLESHKRSHTGARPFQCSVIGCNRSFTQSSSRNVHEKRVHKIGKYAKCNYANCETSFSNFSELQKHSQQHQALATTINSMNTINQQFDQIPLGTKTTNVIVGGTGDLQSLAYLKNPGKSRKSGNKNGNTGVRRRNNNSNINGYEHVCQHCGKAFAYKVAMKQHSALHGQKNFRCTYDNCNYASYWKHNLRLHQRKHHTLNSSATQQ